MSLLESIRRPSPLETIAHETRKLEQAAALNHGQSTGLSEAIFLTPSVAVLDENAEKSEIQVPNQESGEVLVSTPKPVQDPAPVARVETIEEFTIMVASQGNELFNSKYASGENRLWLRLAHVWLIGASPEDGSLVMNPLTGAASAWQVTDDGFG